VLLRPDDVIHDDRSPTRAEVLHKAFRGADIMYTLRLESGTEVCPWFRPTTTTPSARRSGCALRPTT
jgi:hypothetical protein